MGQWNRSTINELQRLYVALGDFFAHNLCFTVAVADVADASELDYMVKGMLVLGDLTKTTLKIVQLAIVREVDIANIERDSGSLLRASSFAMKLAIGTARVACNEYLRVLLGPILDEVIMKDAWYEIDTSKLGDEWRRKHGEPLWPATSPRSCVIPDEDGSKEKRWVEQTCKENAEKLAELAGRIFDAFAGTDGTHRCPPHVRQIASYIVEAAAPRLEDDKQVVALVGGFIILRLICPAILSCDTNGLVAPGQVTPKIRRTLILVSKVLQNLSNFVTFGDKESYMTPLNGFVERNMKRMSDFLSEVPDSGVKQPSKTAGLSAFELSKSLSLLEVDIGSPTSTVGVELFSEKQLECLTMLHKFLHGYGGRMIDVLQVEMVMGKATRDRAATVKTRATFKEFQELLDKLGEAPCVRELVAPRSPGKSSSGLRHSGSKFQKTISRSKTTVLVDSAVMGIAQSPITDVSEDDISAFLEVFPTAEKDDFPFEFFFDVHLVQVVDDLRECLGFASCSCKQTNCWNCVFRLTGSGLTGADLSPVDYLDRVEVTRAQCEKRGKYDETSVKVVKHLGNVCGHLMFVHVDMCTSLLEMVMPTWESACYIIAFCKAFMSKDFAIMPDLRALACAMIVTNRKLSLLGQNRFDLPAWLLLRASESV